MLIDANADPDTVAARVWTALRDRLFADPRNREPRMSARKVEREIAVRIRAKRPICSGIARRRRRCWPPTAAGAFRMPG